MITELKQIVEEACRRGRRRLAVACANDEHSIMAAADAYHKGIASPTLYGDKPLILSECKRLGIDPEIFTIVDEKNDVKCVAMAVNAAATGHADILMKGLVSTDKYMRGILNKTADLFPAGSLLSHVSVFDRVEQQRLLCVADVAVIPLPDFKQKVKIIGYLATIARSLGIDCPKIAAIAPSEQLLPAVVSSTDGAILAKMADRGQLGDIILDGPLSLDVALYPEVVKEKNVKGSRVAGDADCLLFPNIESGNVFFKAATHMGGSDVAAIVVGTKVPCVLTSRGDTPLSKLYSIALACLQVK